MTSLERRVAKIEAASGADRHCALCELLARIFMPPAEAAEAARHAPHTLEALVLESYEEVLR
jgi:hypothetical protein